MSRPAEAHGVGRQERPHSGRADAVPRRPAARGGVRRCRLIAIWLTGPWSTRHRGRRVPDCAGGPRALNHVSPHDAQDSRHRAHGALGAGKTTLINRIVSESGQRILVIENEFGEVSAEGAPVIATDEEIFEMDDGLVCGTVRRDLIRALVSITRRRAVRPHPDRATGPPTPARSCGRS